MNTRSAVAALWFLLVAAAPIQAQEGGPERLAREYFAVLQQEGLSAVAKFMHPDALSDFKEMLLPVFEAEASAGQSQLKDVTFGQLPTIADIRGMDPQSFMSGFMNIIIAQTGGVQLSFDALDIVGVVAEGEQRHVLARMTVGADELSVTQFEVLSFIPFGDSWRLQLNGEMQGLAAALRASMEGLP